MCHQISFFLDSYLEKQQCGFRKGCSIQYCMLVMLEKWKNAVGKGVLLGIIKRFFLMSPELQIMCISLWSILLVCSVVTTGGWFICRHK